MILVKKKKSRFGFGLNHFRCVVIDAVFQRQIQVDLPKVASLAPTT
jgi:hypothetical protein